MSENLSLILKSGDKVEAKGIDKDCLSTLEEFSDDENYTEYPIEVYNPQNANIEYFNIFLSEINFIATRQLYINSQHEGGA
ncbi:MAG: hypothetical protein NT078_02150 [Candidatus Azambacteria bacterium]|nr:hypothetical protein [Candidatus Azambacteria bacterium]